MASAQPVDAARRPLASSAQVAEYLGIPEATLRQWRWEANGPRYHRVGRHVRYRWEDVDEWLGRQAEGGA